MSIERVPRSVALALSVWVVPASDAATAVREIRPPDSFEAAVESLAPGDTLIVHAGTYSDSGRISISVRGTSTAPVVIRGADGEARPVITRSTSAALQNTINIEGATYLTVRGLEIIGNGGDGVNLNSLPSYITLEDLLIHDCDVGINVRSSADHLQVRWNHIHHTGRDGGTGEAMYIGCNYATCVVRDSVFEGNWIHDTQVSTQGDGIEVKHGSHSNVVRDNVIHDTGYPCVLLYGTQGGGRNVVEGNVMWNCGDSGIQAAADAVIRNNLILDSPGSGFNSQDHQGATPQNLEFVHNTIVGGSPCLRLSNWGSKTGLVLANNAVYCEGGGYVISSLTGVTVAGNVLVPGTSAIPSSGYRVGRSTAQDLLNAAAHNVYPTSTSPLIDAGAAAWVTAIDFNGTARTGVPDAGAYTWTGSANPGWVVTLGFKPPIATQAPAAPTGLRAQ
jgi:Right handed beta helix region